MRNIINHQDISVFLSNLVQKKPECKIYIESNIKNFLYRNAEYVRKENKENLYPEFKNNKYFDFVIVNSELEDEMCHHLDYWMNHFRSNLNITYQDLKLKSDEYDKSNRSNVTENISEGIVIPINERFDENYALVRLYDKKSFQREGKLLNHCVADYYRKYGEYDDHHIGDKLHGIFSYRDINNNPIFTIEIQGGMIYQIKGFNNGSVDIEKYPFLKQWLEDQKTMDISQVLERYSWEVDSRSNNDLYGVTAFMIINFIAIMLYIGYRLFK